MKKSDLKKLGNGKVIIFIDNQTIFTLAYRIHVPKKFDATVHIAASEEKLKDLLRTVTPDVVVIDYDLENTLGTVIAQRLINGDYGEMSTVPAIIICSSAVRIPNKNEPSFPFLYKIDFTNFLNGSNFSLQSIKPFTDALSGETAKHKPSKSTLRTYKSVENKYKYSRRLGMWKEAAQEHRLTYPVDDNDYLRVLKARTGMRPKSLEP